MSIQTLDPNILRLLPEHRNLSKRGVQLTLDDLIDDYRKFKTLSNSDFDLVMMAYRLEFAFLEFYKAFSDQKAKPSTLADLWRLAFAAIITRDNAHPAQITNTFVESSKKIFGEHSASPTNAFCRKLVTESESIKSKIEKSPEYLLGPFLLDRWKTETELKKRFSSALIDRPENGVGFINEDGIFARAKLAERPEKSQILSKGSYDWIEFCFQESKKTFSKETPINLLDACAAPGGKLISFYVLSKNTFTFDKIIATDAKFKRLERLKENIQLWQIPALCSLVEWGTQKETAPVKAQNYDIILADLPCSGLGTLLSRPDILTKKVSNAVYELQNKILDDLFLKLKKPGLLLVSICSSDPQEIENVSKKLKKKPDFTSKVSHDNSEEITGWALLLN